MAETDVNDLLNALEDAHNRFSAKDENQLVQWQAHQAARAEAELGAGQGRPRPADTQSFDDTDAGEQAVIPGAEQIGQGELAQRRANEGLRPIAAQKDTEGLALFGDSHKQTDLLDMIPVADREDATDVRMVNRDEVLSAEPRESFLADLIDACKV